MSEPIKTRAWLTETDQGDMLWLDHKEASAYTEDGEPIALVRQADAQAALGVQAAEIAALRKASSNMRVEVTELRIVGQQALEALEAQQTATTHLMQVPDAIAALRAAMAQAVQPDLTQLHANGAKAWADVPDATGWVDELRGGDEVK